MLVQYSPDSKWKIFVSSVLNCQYGLILDQFTTFSLIKFYITVLLNPTLYTEKYMMIGSFSCIHFHIQMFSWNISFVPVVHIFWLYVI